jgi:copper(I)-binding protein
MEPRLLCSGRGFFMFSKWTLLLLSLGTAQAYAQAAVYQLGHIQVSRLRAPPPPPTADVAAVYLWIINDGNKADSLVAVSSPIAAKAEIHSSAMTQGVMQMRPVEAVDLPVGVPVKIEPGTLHIMLRGLKQSLRPGSAFPLTLQFRDAGMLLVQVPVEALE